MDNLFFVVAAILSIIARGLWPILHDPDKIHQSFSKWYQCDRRKTNKETNSFNGENKRKITCWYPKYVPYEKMKFYFLRYVFALFICYAFMPHRNGQ